jgi:hypothetical protein
MFAECRLQGKCSAWCTGAVVASGYVSASDARGGIAADASGA